MFKKRFSWIGLIFACVLTAFGLIASATYYASTQLGNIAEVFRMVKTVGIIEKFYIGETNPQLLYTGAMRGMFETLDDPYSLYLDQEEYEELSELADGVFGGVGVVLGIEDKKYVVIAPIDNTPAYKAGIKPGDYILAVDGNKTAGQDLDAVVKLIRGEHGTTVELIMQTGTEEPRNVKIVRSDIKIDSVYGEMKENKIGYIRISSFNTSTGKDFAFEYQKLGKEGMQALVLDLRGNPGGVLTSGVEVAKLLVPKGPIVSVTEKSGRTLTEYSVLPKVKYPLAVLVDKGSASASEIVAGAIQDTKSGKLFGVKTFGKGSVQTVFPLGNNSGIKLTMAKYYTPNGRSIHGVGIEPDVVITASDRRGSNQLAAAIEYLQEVLAAERDK